MVHLRLVYPWVVLGIALGSCASAPFARSDHFDGEKFFNPNPIDSPGVIALARHIVFGRDGDWPESILEPQAVPELGQGQPNLAAVTFVNHATLLLEFDALTVLTDPVWSDRVGPFTWAGPHRARKPGVPFEELPPIDVVLISHDHYDHLDAPSVDRLAREHAPLFLVPLGVKSWFEARGIGRVVELDWWQTFELPKRGDIVFCPAQHNSGRSPFSTDETLWGSFLIRHRDGLVYFAGDSAYQNHFREIAERFGPVDIALLPIGAYAPRESMRAFHMDPLDAVHAHQDLGAGVSIAMHFGTFQLTGEDFDAPPRELARALTKVGVDSDTFVVLSEGETRTIVLETPPSTQGRPPVYNSHL
ncbi:MAG: MBL fold metallo-hydrolase [Myxococcota bacterium]